jgi:phospholipid/cholesterol/gamma-HCH transport system substrate-binding protein
MRWSTAAGVGVVVVMAAAIMVAVYVLLASAGVVGNTYPLSVAFDNAQGVTKGTEVRLAGVKIGEVDKVDVTEGNRALLTLRIKQKYDVPNDAEIRLASSGLLTTPVVEIVPKRRGAPGKGVRVGTAAPTLDQLLPEGEKLLQQLTGLSESMQKVVGDPQLRRNLQRSTANIAAVSETGKAIAENLRETSVSSRQIAAQFRVTSSRLDRTAALVQQTVADNRGKLGETLTTVNDTLGAMQGLVQQLTTLVADPKVRGSMQNTLANVEHATANLEKLSGNLETLSGDPKLNDDLRATVSETRATVEETHRLMQRLNRIHIGGRRATEGAQEQIRKTDVTVDLAQQSNPGRLRMDLNAYLPAGPAAFYRAGLYDLSEGNKLNLQRGQRIGGNWLRYGLYASRLGLGFDMGPPTRPRLSADLYGLADPQLDLHGRARLNPTLDLTFGVQSLFNRNAPTVGVTWRR